LAARQILFHKISSPQGDKAVISFGNLNHCKAMIEQTANGRPYNSSK